MAPYREEKRDSYEHSPLAETDAPSSDGTVTPIIRHQKTSVVAKRARRLAGALCLSLAAIALGTSWLLSILQTWRVAREVSLARQVQLPQTRPFYVPGASIEASGFGLVYNRSYCDGIRDPAGARARGCVLDPIAGGWIHHLCSDTDLLMEFTALPDFGWFLDENRTRRVPQAQVWAGNLGGRKVLYTVDDYHFRHCEYSVRSLIKNYGRRDVGLGQLLLDHDHMNHCLGRLVDFNTPEIRGEPSETVVLTASAECYKAL